MGAIDEHWCSDCKRTLNKTKDCYLDLESIRLKVPGKKGILCDSCLKKPEYTGLRKLLGAGNPDFLPFIECGLHAVCATFKAVATRPVRCGHVAVIGDTIYCKRRHPGTVKLLVERAERVKLEHRLLTRFLRKIMHLMPGPVGEATVAYFEEAMKGAWQPPSAVVSQSEPPAEEILEGPSSATR